uniref:Gastric inhibitory polypeptide n=1 Tax=Athene cunicularia TaxID=194338 RepID=A0A663MSB0_ATHCN
MSPLSDHWSRGQPFLLPLTLSLSRTQEVDSLSIGVRPVQRRYSEATLASDYSRTMDSMLKKNFVEWLLARREKKSDNIIEPYKREAEPQVSAGNGQRLDLGTEEAKDFFAWLLKAKKNQR